VTRGGEPLLVHEARLPGLHTNRWSRTRGDEPLARELSRILHHGCPLTGVPCVRWSFQSHMGGPIGYRGRRSGPGIGSVEPAMTNVFLLPRSTASRGGGEAFWNHSPGRLLSPGLSGLLSAPKSLGCFGQVVGSSAPKRRGVRMRSGPGAKSISLGSRFSDSLTGAVKAVAFRFFFPLRQDRSEGWSLFGLAAAGLRILRA
jgi:hypothetical protein